MKIDRLLSIILLMLKKKKVTASELASYFETSVRTIYRDIDTLCLAGVPVVSEPGSGGGYSLMEGFTLDKQFFKPEEILMLIAGLKGMEDVFEDKSLSGAIEKVETLGEALPLGKGEPVEIDLFGWGSSHLLKESVKLIFEAVSKLRVISFSYSNLKGENSSRSVEPYRIFFRAGNWYLTAFCLMRGDYRFFKISRMADLVMEETSFSPREESEWSRVSDPIEGVNPVATEMEFVIVGSAVSRTREFFADSIIEEYPDGSVRVVVAFPVDEWVYSYLLGYGEAVTILRPDSLREELVRRAGKFVENNKKDNK